MKKKMFGNLEFGTVNDVSLSHLGLAIRNAAGEMVSYDPSTNEIVNVDLIEFDVENMIYAIPCAVKDIKVGDVILHTNRNPVFVIDIEDGIKVVDVVEGEKKEILPTKSIFGFNFVTKIVSLVDFSSISASASEDSPFGSLLPLIMMSNSKGNSMKDILPMMTLMRGDSGLGNLDLSNPLMLMALTGGSEGTDFFQTMMMTQIINQKSPN